MASDGRAEVLARVRSGVGDNVASTRESVGSEWTALPRNYIRQPQRSREEILDLLEDRLRDYDAHVERVSQDNVREAISRRLLAHGSPRMIMPKGIPTELLEGIAAIQDAGFNYQELDGFGGVMTMATVAIALTGTLVLQNVAGQGRRATTLIPDYHLCVVGTESVVETVPEAMARLQPTAALATTFISGPSATADIEMTRIKGVHGPRVLDVPAYSVAAAPGCAATSTRIMVRTSTGRPLIANGRYCHCFTASAAAERSTCGPPRTFTASTWPCFETMASKVILP